MILLLSEVNDCDKIKLTFKKSFRIVLTNTLISFFSGWLLYFCRLEFTSFMNFYIDTMSCFLWSSSAHWIQHLRLFLHLGSRHTNRMWDCLWWGLAHLKLKWLIFWYYNQSMDFLITIDESIYKLVIKCMTLLID